MVNRRRSPESRYTVAAVFRGGGYLVLKALELGTIAAFRPIAWGLRRLYWRHCRGVPCGGSDTKMTLSEVWHYPFFLEDI